MTRPAASRRASTTKKTFRAELLEGHKGVVVAVVPFDPEEVWSRKPVRLAGRRHGWPVEGTVARRRFEGYVGERWGRFFVIVEDALREAAGVEVGDEVAIALAPSEKAEAIERAVEQSKRTTQPGKARGDAVR